jgi:hypothetical protein
VTLTLAFSIQTKTSYLEYEKQGIFQYDAFRGRVSVSDSNLVPEFSCCFEFGTGIFLLPEYIVREYANTYAPPVGMKYEGISQHKNVVT